MKRNAIAWAALVVSVAALVGSRGYNRPLPAAQDIPQEGQKVARELSNAFNAVAEFVSPSVVQINIEKKGSGVRMQRGGPGGQGGQPVDPKEMEELLKKFFGQGQGFQFEDQQFAASGTGSGFVYDDSGHILTNNHVVEGADKIVVTFHDGEKLSAEIVGVMPEADVAVIKVDTTEYPAARIGTSEDLRVGEWVMAIGSPFGLSQTVTAGIISATERDNVDINQFESFIQTDASINPGNSGGPLVDMDGRVVGINSAIATTSRSNAGVGFAIPIDMAKRLADKLIKNNGKVERALMGVSINPLNPALARKLGLNPRTEGVLVVEVGPGTPADEAGLKVGDVITKFDGNPVHSGKTLQYLVSTSDIGKAYPLTYLRKGHEQTTKVSPAPLSQVASVMRPGARVDEKPRAASKDAVNDFGLAVTGLNDELADKYGWSGKTGVVIASVKPESPAAAAGLEVGDLITKVVKDEAIVPVKSVEDFESVVKDSKEIAVYVEDVNHRLPGDFKVLARPETTE